MVNHRNETKNGGGNVMGDMEKRDYKKDLAVCEAAEFQNTKRRVGRSEYIV